MNTHGMRITLAAATALALVACGGNGAEEGSGDPAAPDEAWQPDRPITYIIPYGTGGSTDPIGRQYASQLSEILGVEVIVENREGGAATIGTSAIVTATPDCYTIGLSNQTALSNQPLLTPELPWDSADDYQPLVKLTDVPVVLAVGADTPWQTLEEFVAHVEANPGEVGYATSGVGGTPDTNAVLLEQEAGLALNRVPFSGGGGEALTAVVGGQIESIGTFFTSMAGFIDSGDVRPLGVFYEGTYDALPDVPSIPDMFPGAAIPAAYYTIAPADLPEDCFQTLVDASEEIVNSEEYTEFAAEQGYVMDPILTDELAEEITDYVAVFEELQASGS